MADKDSEPALGSWAALEIRGTIHTELPSLWSLFPAFSLGQRMFANSELVSVHSGGSGQLLRLRARHLASSVQVGSRGLPKTCSGRGKTRGIWGF